MEIILLENLEKFGNIGDIVEVKNGFARNYLIPQGKALRANNENKAEFESRKADIEKANKAKRGTAEKIAAGLDGEFFVLIRQAGEDGRLYGSVNARDIAGEIVKKESEVKRNQVVLNIPIKNLGVHTVKISLHAEVSLEANVIVARSKAEAEEAKKEFLNPAKKNDAQEAAEAPAPAENKAEEGDQSVTA